MSEANTPGGYEHFKLARESPEYRMLLMQIDMEERMQPPLAPYNEHEYPKVELPSGDYTVHVVHHHHHVNTREHLNTKKKSSSSSSIYSNILDDTELGVESRATPQHSEANSATSLPSATPATHLDTSQHPQRGEV